MWIKVISIPIIVISVTSLLLIWIENRTISFELTYGFIEAYKGILWNFLAALVGYMGILTAVGYRMKLFCMCKNEFYRHDGQKNLSKCDEFEGKYSEIYNELRKRQRNK